MSPQKKTVYSYSRAKSSVPRGGPALGPWLLYSDPGWLCGWPCCPRHLPVRQCLPGVEAGAGRPCHLHSQGWGRGGGCTDPMLVVHPSLCESAPLSGSLYENSWSPKFIDEMITLGKWNDITNLVICWHQHKFYIKQAVQYITAVLEWVQFLTVIGFTPGDIFYGVTKQVFIFSVEELINCGKEGEFHNLLIHKKVDRPTLRANIVWLLLYSSHGALGSLSTCVTLFLNVITLKAFFSIQ